MLTESRTTAVPGEEGGTAAVQRRRVRSQDHAIHETLRFHRVNADRIERTNTAGRQRKIDAGRFRQGPYFWYGNSEDLPQLPPDDAILHDSPCGYVLTADQVQFLEPWFDGYDVHSVRVGDQTYVPMGQAAQPVIGLMLDGRAASNEVVAEPWPSEPAGTHLACATDRKGFEPGRGG